MKKITVLALSVLLSVILAACAGVRRNEGQQRQESQQEVSSAVDVAGGKEDKSGFAATPKGEVSSEQKSFQTDAGEEASVPAEENIAPEESETVGPAIEDRIRPEFKAAMDSYEAFFDEYINFMQEFERSDDFLNMATEYAEYLAQYQETMEKMEKIQEQEMSEAESLYFAEVSLRINQKLLEVAE